MIKLSKERETDTTVLVFDVRPKQICIERRIASKVLLGHIEPFIAGENEERFRWWSRWGYNTGETNSLQIAQDHITTLAKGMYK